MHEILCDTDCLFCRSLRPDGKLLEHHDIVPVLLPGPVSFFLQVHYELLQVLEAPPGPVYEPSRGPYLSRQIRGVSVLLQQAADVQVLRHSGQVQRVAVVPPPVPRFRVEPLVLGALALGHYTWTCTENAQGTDVFFIYGTSAGPL